MDLIINVDLVKENCPSFTLLLLHNFDKKVITMKLFGDKFLRSIMKNIKIQFEKFQELSDLAKIIGMITSNSCSTKVNYFKQDLAQKT